MQPYAPEAQLMEIQVLALLVTEKDLNDFVARHMRDQPVENLRFRIAPEGLHVTGEYPLFFKVHFETLWELGLRGGDVTLRLVTVKAMGLPGTAFKSTLLKMMTDGAKKDWLRLEDDTVVVQVDRALVSEGVALRTNLKAIRYTPQGFLVEAKAPGT
jgi:hypothetical protein